MSKFLAKQEDEYVNGLLSQIDDMSELIKIQEDESSSLKHKLKRYESRDSERDKEPRIGTLQLRYDHDRRDVELVHRKKRRLKGVEVNFTPFKSFEIEIMAEEV